MTEESKTRRVSRRDLVKGSAVGAAGVATAGMRTDFRITPDREGDKQMNLPASRAEEWRAHWPLVLTCCIGFSISSIPVLIVGIVLQPLAEEFGWSRTQATIGMTIASVMSIPLAPLIGAMVDRWGVRRIALPGLIATTGATVAFGLANGSITQWIVLWAFFGAAVIGVKAVLWTTAIASTFTHARAVAMSIVLGGTALASTVVPPVAQFLTDAYSWRCAYVGLALLFGVPAFVLSLAYMFDARDRMRRHGRNAASVNVALPGLTVREALRNASLYRIGLSTLITIAVSGGLSVHQVPLLSEAGLDRQFAALLASLTGVAALFGKVTTGWLMDRYDAGWIGAITNFIAVLALLCLLEEVRTPALIVGGFMMLGYAAGTGMQICAVLTSIYGGLRNYGKIFGVMASVMSVAFATGPLLASIARDISGGYNLFVFVAVPLKLIAGALLVRLGSPACSATRPEAACPPSAPMAQKN